MTAPLTEASANPLRRSKACKFNRCDLLTRSTPKVCFRMQGFINFTRGLQLPICKSWLPLKNICTYTIYFPLHQRYAIGVSPQLFKHNQQIPCRIKPRTRNMIPEIINHWSSTLLIHYWKSEAIDFFFKLTIFGKPPHIY